MDNAKKYSYFEFLLDKSGSVLKKYLEEERKDPSPWELCKQLIEKSLAIKMTASHSQVATEKELKVYETQRIWQPLCLAMTMMAHLKWDLDLIQQNVPLHLQQILMEELLKGYGISQVPKPEDFDINKYRKRAAMVHILYNRWVVRTITKYEELKEKDILPSNISISQRELKENQELQILMKIKEYRSLSIDILERSVNLACGKELGVEVLRNAAKGLWKSVFKIVAESCEASLQQGPPPTPAISRARGPLEDKHMRDLQCFLKKDELVEIMLKLKDDNILTLLLSCLTSLLSITMKDSAIETKDSYSHLWPSTLDGSVTTTVEVLSVLKPLCEYCLRKNSRNISWLRTIGDVYLVEGNYQQAMKCYLEVGSITTSFFSRPVPSSVWDEKIYRNMITCCQKQKSFMQVIVLCQFLEPVDYAVAFKAIRERCSEDGMDVFYDCIWDINILEYLIYAHDKRGETEMRKLAVKTIGQPELNCRGSAEILQQSRDIRKIRFLRALTKIFWT